MRFVCESLGIFCVNLGMNLMKHILLCVIFAMLGMARIVHVHHVDKDAFLKGNIEPDPDELYLVFERSVLRMRSYWNK